MAFYVFSPLDESTISYNSAFLMDVFWYFYFKIGLHFCMDHVIIQVGKDPRRFLSGSICCLKQGQLWDQDRFLRTLTSLESLQAQRHQSLFGQQWKCFPLYPVWISLFSIFACCLLSSHHAPVWRVCLHPLGGLPSVTGPPGPSSPPKAASSPRLNEPRSSILSIHGKCNLTGKPWLYQWPFTELTQFETLTDF